MVGYNIIYNSELEASHKKELVEGLNQHAFQQKGLGQKNGAFSFAIVDADNKFLAGLQAYSYYGCCHIDLLYVQEMERGKGYGSVLLHQAFLRKTWLHSRVCQGRVRERGGDVLYEEGDIGLHAKI